MESIVVFCPSKINLGLKILGKNEKNYHLLQSLFLPLDLIDEMLIEEEEKDEVICFWDETYETHLLPQNGDNTVGKVLALWDLSRPRLRIEIQKRIPMGSGLGGGSSNAGTLLRWAIQNELITTEKATSLALQVGADVPFFLNARPSWVEGIGEKISSLGFQLPKLFVVLVFPPSGLSTKEVFAGYDKMSKNFSAPSSPPKNWDEVKAYLKSMKNDLLPAATEKLPLLNSILEKLKALDSLGYGMSGSGSTCYAVFDSAPKAENAIKEILPFCRTGRCRGVLSSTI